MPDTRQPSGARKWVLVVDDNSRLRNLWLEVLEEAGYAAVGSEDGLAAGELIRDLFPDLILLDLRMPRASGWDFLENVRANPKWQRIPVVIVSAHASTFRSTTAWLMIDKTSDRVSMRANSSANCEARIR